MTFLRILLAPTLVLAVALATPAAAAATKPAAKKSAGKSAAEAATKSVPSTPPADASAMADLKKTNQALKRVLAKQRPTWSPEGAAKNAELHKLIGDLLNFDELARRALAKHWDGITPSQRTDFVTTLRDLVARSYVKQVYGQPDYDVKFDHEEKHDSESSVTATLAAVTNGKKVTLALEYKLLWKDGRWRVYDIITDEQSLLENYRAEFNKIINKESFEGLHKRMKRKLEEKRE